MSERKTAEIKFRCTPTFKASAQAQAEAEGISASQLIENAVQNHIWAERAQKTTKATVVDIDALLADTDRSDSAAIHIATGAAEPRGLGVLGSVEFVPGERMCDDGYACLAPDCPCPRAAKVACGCRPWEFCRCKATA